MSPTRRNVLIGLGGLSGATLAYALRIGHGPRNAEEPPLPSMLDTVGQPRGRPNVEFDVRDWLVISADGSVTGYTSRTEIGQGLTTVMYDLIAQGLDLPRARIHIVLGDTDVCPHHGPTTGSGATRYVGWAFWIACHEIRRDLVHLAAEASGRPANRLAYRSGEIIDLDDRSRTMGIGELADGRVRRVDVDPEPDSTPPPYVDRQTRNVNAEAIVTGTHMYANDYHPEGCVYAAYASPEYHPPITQLEQIDLSAARAVPGVVRVKQVGRFAIALGETYTAARAAIRALNPQWMPPERPARFDREAEIRAGAELAHVVESTGDDNLIEAGDHRVIRETYLTQYMSQVPLETHTAIASDEDGRLTIRLCNQNPFWVRHKVATLESLEPEAVHVISTPAGGAFGAKADHKVGEEVGRAKRLTDRPVKLVYSRDDDIRRRGRYKEAVVFDIASAVGDDGLLLARSIDIYQDEGHGTRHTYRVPNVRTRLFRTPLPLRHGTMRGTSYVQSVFGVESHTDMVAEVAGIDPLEFRRRNAREEFRRLLDACGKMLDYGGYQPPDGGGIGFGICHHGGAQLGVVGADVRVDTESGEVTIERLAGAFDFGLVINRPMAINGIKSAMIWGLGAALFEEVEVDGHRSHTTGFGDYRIARMGDVPPIEVATFDDYQPGIPRGCGELPLPPTVAAIANAVYDAIGIRLYELPLTPARVLAALA